MLYCVALFVVLYVVYVHVLHIRFCTVCTKNMWWTCCNGFSAVALCHWLTLSLSWTASIFLLRSSADSCSLIDISSTRVFLFSASCTHNTTVHDHVHVHCMFTTLYIQCTYTCTLYMYNVIHVHLYMYIVYTCTCM